eukprot:scaffold461_cov234-Chaetoceros_neogracile.AAC.2
MTYDTTNTTNEDVIYLVRNQVQSPEARQTKEQMTLFQNSRRDGLLMMNDDDDDDSYLPTTYDEGVVEKDTKKGRYHY